MILAVNSYTISNYSSNLQLFFLEMIASSHFSFNSYYECDDITMLISLTDFYPTMLLLRS